MQKLTLLLLLFSFSYPSLSSVEEALIYLKTNKEKALEILEDEFDKEESPSKRAEISYLIALDPTQKTKRSMSYYIKNTLLNYKDLKEGERYKLYRYLAELSFKEGDLKSALKHYDLVLERPETIKGIKDYLTLQRSWVLINLNRYEEAIMGLHQFLLKEDGKLQEIMSHDLGKFITEGLFHKDVSKKNKTNIRKIFKEIKVKSPDFYAGLHSGFQRGEDFKGKRERFESLVVESPHYEAFYAYSLLNEKFERKGPCDFLKWGLPSSSTKKLSQLLIKKSFKCQKDQEKVEHVVAFVEGQEHYSMELVLLQKSIGSMNLCPSALLLLKEASTLKKSLSDILKITGGSCHQQSYQKRYLKVWSDLSSDIKAKFSHELEARYLNTIIAYENKEDAKELSKHLQLLATDFRSLGESKQRNLLVIAFKSGSLRLADQWLKKAPKELYHKRIYPLALIHAESLNSIQRDPILKFLTQRHDETKIEFKNSDLKRVRPFISKETYNNLVLFRDLAVLKWRAPRIKSLKVQDHFFFKTRRLVRKVTNARWINPTLKSRFLNIFRETLKVSSKTLERYQTEISKPLKVAMNKWQESL